MKALNKKGFTLSELLIVMAIVVVLAAVAVPTFGKQLETSRETADLEGIRAMYTDAISYAIIDAQDGAIDGKNGSIDWTSTGPATGVTYASSKYTFTFATITPAFTITQKGANWQFVNSKISGQAVPAIIDSDGKKAPSVIFEFELTSEGTVQLKTDGITVGTLA